METAPVTPNLPVELAGYGYFLNRVATVADRSIDGWLDSSVVTLQDGDTAAALCSVDLIGVDEDTVKRVQDTVSNQIESDVTLFVSASHTHSGPATRQMLGAGNYNRRYIDEALVPRLTTSLIRAFGNAQDGGIGIARGELTGLTFNRTTTGTHIDNRVTTIMASTGFNQAVGVNFPCHPTVFGKNSTRVSSDYPGYARAALRVGTGASKVFWQTGCGANIEPIMSEGLDVATVARQLGTAVGETAAELSQGIKNLHKLNLRTASSVIELPLDTGFELQPQNEVEHFREMRGIPKTADLTPYKNWVEAIAPLINAKRDVNLQVPLTIVAIGNLIFVGYGAEINSETAAAIELAHPWRKIVNVMTTNGHQGYVPPANEYPNQYAARRSAFLFGHKPLLPTSEEILRSAVGQAILDLG